MGRPCGPGLETTQYFKEIVLRVRRKRVSSRVDTDARSTRNIIVEPHVRGFRLIELHVPVAVRWYLFAQLLSQPHLGECGSVRWKRSGWECSRTWITLDGERRERVSLSREISFPSDRFDGIVFRKYCKKKKNSSNTDVKGILKNIKKKIFLSSVSPFFGVISRDIGKISAR